MIMKKTLLLSFLLLQAVWAGDWIPGSVMHPGMMLGVGKYYLYVPQSFHAARHKSLLVMLHGCMQTPGEFASGSHMNDMADKEGFIVLYPIQAKAANEYTCWNWFLPLNTVYRSDYAMIIKNEPGIVLDMVDTIVEKYNLDSGRVFLAGISAGAAMAVNMANCYPDRFKAFGIHSGLQYRAAMKMMANWQPYWGNEDIARQLLTLYDNPTDQYLDPVGESAREGYRCAAGLLGGLGGLPLKPVKAIIFHGSKDRLNVHHAERLVQELSLLNDYIDDGAQNASFSLEEKTIQVDNSPNYDYELTTLQHEGETFIKFYKIFELGHAWSGGDNAYTFNDQHGPDASLLMIEFFKANGLQGGLNHFPQMRRRLDRLLRRRAADHFRPV